MKKFLVFLVSLIVVICLGMTFYYFAKDEEVIKFKTTTVYLNIGDSISLEELGFSHTHKKQETKINFNAGGEAVKSIIAYDSSLGRYITTAQGGSTSIVITTNNRRFKRFEIKVVVGNGSEETPFIIKSEEDLFKIGTSKFDITPEDNVNDSLNSHYILMNDIDLTQNHNAIGVSENSTDIFAGHFDGNYYTIRNLTNQSATYGGLFAVVGENAVIENLYLENVCYNGNYDYVGALAGVINGYVDRIGIKNVNINNSTLDSYTGGLAGKISTISEHKSNYDIASTIYRVNIENDANNQIKGGNFVGGLAGQIEYANLEGIKVDSILSAKEFCGGIAGYMFMDDDYGHIRESYSLCQISSIGSNFGGVVGYLNAGDGSTINKNTVVLGVYFDSNKANLKYVGKTTTNIDTTTAQGKATNELKERNTYVYYYDNDGNPVSWRTNIWNLVEGQYPVLKYTTSAIHNNFDIGSEETDPEASTPTDPVNPSNPGDQGNEGDQPSDTNPDSPIEEPDIPQDINTDIVTISSATDLLNVTFSENKTYRITANIDLKGAVWTPKAINNAKFTSNEDGNYTISNFIIQPKTNYLGFFSSINNSTVSNIKFANVTVNLVEKVNYAGVLAGRVNGATISNVEIISSTLVSELDNLVEIKNLPEYVGGLVGASTNSSATIDSVKVNAQIAGNIKNAGGIIGLVGNNTIVKASSFEGSVQAKVYVGGISAQNKGSLQTVKTNATFISNGEQSIANSYLGGIVATNFGSVENAELNSLNINMINSSERYICSVGGVAAINFSTIKNANVLSGNIKVKKSNSYSYIGGIVAQNQGELSKSANYMQEIGSEYKNVFVGGVVCVNENEVIECITSSDIYGDMVGGIATYNYNNGSIVRSAVMSLSKSSRPCLKGYIVGAIICSMVSGTVEDCLAITKTYGLNATSITAGFVANFPGSETEYGTISHCIVSNQFAGNGNKYLETPDDILGKKRTTGTIKNCVIEHQDGVETASRDKFLWIIKLPIGSKSSYTIAKASDMKNTETYSNLDFDISNTLSFTWICDELSVPVLACLPKQQ